MIDFVYFIFPYVDSNNHHAKALAPTAADRPAVALAHGRAVQEPPIGVHHVVCAQPGVEPTAVTRHGVVELPECGARPDRRHAERGVDADIAQHADVDHGEGAGGASAPEDRAVGEAFVVVAAAGGVDREAVAPAAGDASPRLGDDRRSQEQHRPRSSWGGEAEVLDGGVEQGRAGRRRRCVDEPGQVGGRRRVARDAADEAPVEGDRCIRLWVWVTSWVTFALRMNCLLFRNVSPPMLKEYIIV